MNAIAIEARGLSARLGDTEILHNITLALPRARWTCIVGPNGAGKSTLLKALAGLLPHSGGVALLGRPLADWPSRQRAQQLAWLGQNESSGDDLTVWDVAMLGRLPHQAWLSPPSAADHAAVELAFDDGVVDDYAAVVHRAVRHHFRFAGFFVHFDFADVAAVGPGRAGHAAGGVHEDAPLGLAGGQRHFGGADEFHGDVARERGLDLPHFHGQVSA